MMQRDPDRRGPQPSRLQKGLGRRLVIILAAALAALLCVAAVWFTIVRPPEIPAVRPSAQLPPPDTSAGPVIDAGDAPHISASGRKEGYFTFLMCGKDTAGGGNTDTIMLASYDVKHQDVNVMSIPRDTMVNVAWDIKRLNSVYGVLELDGLKKHIGKLTGITPDFCIMVEWEAVGELVEAIGGVMFEVPFDMDYDDPAQNLHIHQKAGLRRLNGDDAMQVVRWRKNNRGSSAGDVQRVQIQQDFLMAVAKETLKLSNLGRIDELARIFTENVETELTIGNLVWFGTKAITMKPEEDLHFCILPGDIDFSYYSYHYKNMQSYVLPDAKAIVALMNERFNPYLRDVTVEDLEVLVEKADGTLGVTSGTLADPRVGKPRPTPAPAPTPTPTPEPVPTQAVPEVSPEVTPEIPAEPTPAPEPLPTEEPIVTTQPPETGDAEA